MDKEYKTALLFDQIIKNTNNLNFSEDLSLAIEEFALGQPQLSRQIEVCFGFAPIAPLTSSQAMQQIIIGKGLVRWASQYFIESSNFYLNLMSSFDNQTISDAYIMGSLVLSVYEDSFSGNKSVVLNPVFVLGGGSTPMPLILKRDLGETEMLSFKSAIIPTNSIEIGNFVLSVDSYANSQNDSVKVLYQDKRVCRGWAGFAEETMSTMFTPALITYNQLFNQNTLIMNNTLKACISKWISLPSWSPNFIGYWSQPNNSLPTNLKSYINTNFGTGL